MGGARYKYPTAKIDIQSECITGVVKAAVIENLEEEIIIGSSIDTNNGRELIISYCEADVVEWKNTERFSSSVRVNGCETKCLYDTGANCVAVKERLVELGQYTGKTMACDLPMEGQKTILWKESKFKEAISREFLKL